MSQPIHPKPLPSGLGTASTRLSPAILRRLSRLEVETGFVQSIHLPTACQSGRLSLKRGARLRIGFTDH